MEPLLRLLPSPFFLLLAAVPLVAYFGVLAMIRLSGRALVTTAGRDAVALALAISGLVVIGPVELFFPSAAATLFGPRIWLWLAAFYLLCVSLVAITLRPRLVIYGRSAAEVFPALVRAATRMDPRAIADPERLTVTLPHARVQLRVDGHPGADHAEVIAFERVLPPGFWSLLLSGLRSEVATAPRLGPRQGLLMLVVALSLAALVLWRGIDQQALVLEEFRMWLWR